MMRGGTEVHGHSVLLKEGENCVTLRLKSRKNRPHGAVIKRYCSCGNNAAQAHPMCPVHSLWDSFFADLQPGAQPWARLIVQRLSDGARESGHDCYSQTA